MNEHKAITKFSMEKVHSMPRGVLHEFSAPTEDCKGSLKIAITDTLGIVDGTMISDKPTQPSSRYNDIGFVEMNFMLQGNILQTQEGLLNGYHYQKGYHNILFNPHKLESNRLMSGGTHHIFSVHILPDKMAALFAGYMPQMYAYAEKILKGEPFVIHAPARKINGDLKFFFDSFWVPHLPQSVGKLYFESKAMELLAHQCSLLLNPAKKETAIAKKELEKIYHAKEILTMNLVNPPSLTELSRLVELNEFKLKKYFKEVFEISVFGLVQEERLKRAKQLIYEGEKNISGIAYDLGYAHPQHFHRAFKKRFGTTPRSLLK